MSETGRLIDEQMIRRAVATLVPDGNSVFEVRIIGKRGKSKPISGYFTDADTLINALSSVNLHGMNVYITLQAVNEDCYSRSQNNHFEMGVSTTTDGDIVGYRWLFIDLDPIRTSDVSSTHDELTMAAELCKKVYGYLQGVGFEKPLVAFSGNGYHLLYRISLAKNDENTTLVHNCLIALDAMFSTDKVKIDTVNYNPSRICKLYGTMAQKGANTEKRSHRMAGILSKECELIPTKKIYLETLASSVHVEKIKAESYNGYNPNGFDVVEWMTRHGMGFTEKTFSDGGKKFVLDECPFDNSHTAPDSMIILQPDGKIGFKCLHNSCKDRTWHDLWTKVDPQTYAVISAEADRRIEAGWKQHNVGKEIKYETPAVGESDEPIWMTAEMIANKPDEDRQFIRTGINLLDYRMKGLEKGSLSLVSGLRGGGKSTLINGWMLNAINDGHTVVCYSGELSDRNMMRWMFLQAAGKAYTVASQQYDNTYYTEKETDLAIARWMGDKFWLYNNVYGNNYQKVYDLIRKQVEEKHADFVIIDNIMSLDLDTGNRDKWDAQTQFIWQLKDLAKISFAHVLFVAHPRKAAGFLRLDDVSGSGNIGNIVDNAFIVHRNNDDFRNKTKIEYKRSDDWEGYSGSNVIEVCKNRDSGVQDLFIPLWYEQETKRLKNYASENIVYGWKNDGYTQVDDIDVPF